MGRSHSQPVIKPNFVPLLFKLPALGRKRSRAYEEWRALDRWGWLPQQERKVPGFLLRKAREEANLNQRELAAGSM